MKWDSFWGIPNAYRLKKPTSAIFCCQKRMWPGRGGGNTARANGIVIPENAPIDESALVVEQEHAGEHNSDIISQKAAATRA
jgi:hypothetical protein